MISDNRERASDPASNPAILSSTTTYIMDGTEYRIEPTDHGYLTVWLEGMEARLPCTMREFNTFVGVVGNGGPSIPGLETQCHVIMKALLFRVEENKHCINELRFMIEDAVTFAQVHGIEGSYLRIVDEVFPTLFSRRKASEERA